MYQKFLFLAGLVLASTVQAQTPERLIMRHIAVDYAIAGNAQRHGNRDGSTRPPAFASMVSEPYSV